MSNSRTSRISFGARIPPARFFFHRLAQFEQTRIPCRVATQRIEQRGLVAHQLHKLLIQLRDGISGIETELLARGIGAVTEAIPDLAFRILLAAEQEALHLVACDQHQHGFRFGEAAEVIEVAVVAIVVMGVCVTRDFRRGGNDSDAALHHGLQAFAAFGMEGGVEHGWYFAVRAMSCRVCIWRNQLSGGDK